MDELWSLVNEGARLQLELRPPHVQGWILPRCSDLGSATASWLRLLGEVARLERPVFSLTSPLVKVSEFGSAAAITQGGGYAYQPALCEASLMRAGRHYAEYTVVVTREETLQDSQTSLISSASARGGILTTSSRQQAARMRATCTLATGC